MKKRILFLALIVIWGCVITSFSAQTGEGSSELSAKITEKVVEIIYHDYEAIAAEHRQELFDTWHYIVRKCAHMTEYAVFSMLVCGFLLTFRRFSYNRERYRLSFIPAAVIASAVFAATDEFHQSFVDGRGPSVKDVGFDTAGAVIGALLVWLAVYLINRRKRVAEGVYPNGDL